MSRPFVMFQMKTQRQRRNNMSSFRKENVAMGRRMVLKKCAFVLMLTLTLQNECHATKTGFTTRHRRMMKKNCIPPRQAGCGPAIPCCNMNNMCVQVDGIHTCVRDEPDTLPAATEPPTTIPPVTDPPTGGVETLPPNVIPVIAEPTPSPSISPQPTAGVVTAPPQIIPVLQDPTAAPTREPVDDPTPPPVPAPTPPPTPVPTAPPPTPPPSPIPTPVPTPLPTRQPTRPPTPVPTPQPSPLPTPLPTVAPTPFPTRSPTPAPTEFPTTSPTFEPTTSAPTVTPGNPTRSPSASPSTAPSWSPSDLPSQSPSVSFHPTLSDSLAPTESSSPSTAPSTDAPSTSPSMAPTLPLQSFLVEITMTLEVASELFGNSISRYQGITAGHIEQELENADLEERLTDLTVFTIIRDQDEIDLSTPAPAPSRFLERESSRVLQQEPLRIRADAGVTFKSPKTFSRDEVADLVGGAFNTDEEREEYMKKLRDTNDDAFERVREITVLINGEEVESGDEGDSGSDFPIVIVAASAGGAAVLLLAAIIFMRRSRGKRAQSNDTPTQLSPVTSNGERISTDIIVEPQDDISTLGDPVYAPGGGMLTGGLERDETVTASIVSGDYDYAKAYGAAQQPPSVSTNTLESKPLSRPDEESSGRGSSAVLFQGGDSLFSDDSSFEQQYNEPEERFEVDAPAGKLGVVIDTPSGGVPVVHAIKETSVLADRVKVGDRLVSVDGTDTTALCAMDVSKLISMKSENPSRSLVFIRSRTKGDD